MSLSVGAVGNLANASVTRFAKVLITMLRRQQGDQIWRIFAHLPIVYLEQFYLKILGNIIHD
jgi:hypothetical protein